MSSVRRMSDMLSQSLRRKDSPFPMLARSPRVHSPTAYSSGTCPRGVYTTPWLHKRDLITRNHSTRGQA